MSENQDGQHRLAKKQKRKEVTSESESAETGRSLAKGEDEPEPKRSRGHYSEDGDLEILSSDNVLFKIPAYILQASSIVFRDAIKHATNSRLELSDLEIETEAVLSGLLDIIEDGRIEVRFQETVELLLIIRLAQKYDCPRVLDCIALQTRCDLLDNGVGAERAFIVGACMNDHALCSKAIEVNEGCWGGYSDEEEENFGRELSNADVMDPAALPYELFRTIKSETMWAWMRAFRVIYEPKPYNRGLGSTELNKAMGREFQRLMQLKDAPKTLS